MVLWLSSVPCDTPAKDLPSLADLAVLGWQVGTASLGLGSATAQGSGSQSVVPDQEHVPGLGTC
jgi:hypothetical protein